MVTRHRTQLSDIEPIEIVRKPFRMNRWDLPLSENALLGAVVIGALLGLITGLLVH